MLDITERRPTLCERAGLNDAASHPKPPLAPQVLQPVPRGDEALRKEQIVQLAGKDVGNAPAVGRDDHLRLQAEDEDGGFVVMAPILFPDARDG